MIQQLNPTLLRVVLALLLAQVVVTAWLLASSGPKAPGEAGIDPGAVLANQDAPDRSLDSEPRSSNPRTSTAASSRTMSAFDFPTVDDESTAAIDAPIEEEVVAAVEPIQLADAPADERTVVALSSPDTSVDLESVRLALQTQNAPSPADERPPLDAVRLESASQSEIPEPAGPGAVQPEVTTAEPTIMPALDTLLPLLLSLLRPRVSRPLKRRACRPSIQHWAASATLHRTPRSCQCPTLRWTPSCQRPTHHWTPPCQCPTHHWTPPCR